MESYALKKLLTGKRYLLLQGPMGPFFNDLAIWLESQEREVRNVVFNGGDKFYCRKRKYYIYQNTPKEFPHWLKTIWYDYPFDTIVCFGDCRMLHLAAKRWAASKNIRFLVFEEGYLRPNFITLEEGGVNAYSSLPRDPSFYHHLPEQTELEVYSLKPSMRQRIWHAIWYYIVSWLYRKKFPLYKHHKVFSPWYECKCWIRAGWRKYWYRHKERHILKMLKTELDKRYFLAILQVYNDSQISHHSPYKDVRNYINDVIFSFSKNASQNDFLVFKHHPMDRGHRLYGPLIKKLSKQYGVTSRVIYVHDLPMPQLLSCAKAVITINSTAGISALIHNRPLKVMGQALYDIKGLTYQGHLNKFWNTNFKPDLRLLKKFCIYLRANTQINAVFYGKRSPEMKIYQITRQPEMIKRKWFLR